tara:strand:+ start:641 stop:877 length:237 start_codon:yes stop_codon:yes gene_type:complete
MKNLKDVSSEDMRLELQSRGLYTYNLWSVEDVKTRFKDVEQDLALEILHDSLTDELTMDAVWSSVCYYGEINDLTYIE